MNHEVDIGCASLDAFLEGELTPCAAAAFETHLRECSACAVALDQQRWIDESLRCPAAAELESAPKAAIVAAIKRRRHRRTALVAAAAAALAAVAAWPLIPLPRRVEKGEGLAAVAINAAPPTKSTLINPSPSPSAPRPLVDLRGRGISEATFVSSSDAIAVPLESPAVNVTVVQVYPTVDAQRRMQLAAALSSISSEPNGG
jgi:hypothetical protein